MPFTAVAAYEVPKSPRLGCLTLSQASRNFFAPVPHRRDRQRRFGHGHPNSGPCQNQSCALQYFHLGDQWSVLID